ncbi:MAG: hypothetical protein KC503_46835 [Myxococcales bacterium]|nr:hypothetical protein [Myxococcales bacterium]
MARRIRTPTVSLCFALALVLALLLAPQQPAAAPTHELLGDKAEKALLSALAKNKLIRAREAAEKILRTRPQSIIARYALAEAFHEEEANLPRALHHMRLAEKQLTTRFGKRPSDALAQRWHRRIILAEEGILGEMDRRKEQLVVLDRYDALYKPPMNHLRIWPLMKLHRFDEAIRISKKLTLSSQQPERIAGYNGLLSVEFERERPVDCFRVALQSVKATGGRSCILALNTAEAAFAVFRFDEVERLAQKSLQAPIKDCPASAHPHLANLFLLRADFQRAVAAVKAARVAGVERKHRQQFEAGLNAWLMRLLYALGQFDKALEIGQRVARAPDRVGLTSFSAEVMRLIGLLDLHAAEQAAAERLRERASARGFGERLKLWGKIKRLELSAWTTRRKAARLLAHGDNLRSLLRPYIKPLPPWRAYSIVRATGAGVMRQAIALERARSRQKSKTGPYFDAWLGEVAYREGKIGDALKLAQSALKGLPRDEVLMRGRVMAWAAEAARRQGNIKDAERYFDAVIHRWPTALRLLGLRLPASIKVEGKGKLARAIGKKLEDSRRLRLDDKRFGFTVRVDQQGEQIGICLTARGGRRYACARVDLSSKDKGKGKGKSFDEKVAIAVDEFHDGVFTPKIDLTQHDINSLDGSAVRGRADRVLKEILGK